MRETLADVCYGIIEGVTEFLPVSSTGHLLIAEKWLPKRTDLYLTVIQCGAVLAVMLVFTERLRGLVGSWREPSSRLYLGKLFLAFFLTALGGLALKAMDVSLPEEVRPVAWATLIGGILILLVEQMVRGKTGSAEVTWGVAVAFAAGQLIAAAFPGASRSGTTILIGLLLGLNRRAATEFSFLLGIPTLLAAGALQIVSGYRDGTLQQENMVQLAVGLVVATITAFAVVKWLLGFIQANTFKVFGWYRIVLGAVLLLWLGGAEP